jgi:hypothetical protein
VSGACGQAGARPGRRPQRPTGIAADLPQTPLGTIAVAVCLSDDALAKGRTPYGLQPGRFDLLVAGRLEQAPPALGIERVILDQRAMPEASLERLCTPVERPTGNSRSPARRGVREGPTMAASTEGPMPDRILYRLTWLAAALSLGHHLDHLIRGDAVGWPLTEDVNALVIAMTDQPPASVEGSTA